MATFWIKVVPGARRTLVVGKHGDAIKVQVAVPPEQGKANQAVIDLLARLLGVSRGQIRIHRGQTSPRKMVEVLGLELPDIHARLGI